MTRLLAVLALLTLRSCGSPAPGEVRVTYLCGEERFPVLYRRDTAFVTLPTATLRLPLALSASGARYSDGAHTVWEHQGRARLELPGDTFASCVPVRPEGA